MDTNSFILKLNTSRSISNKSSAYERVAYDFFFVYAWSSLSTCNCSFTPICVKKGLSF